MKFALKVSLICGVLISLAACQPLASTPVTSPVVNSSTATLGLTQTPTAETPPTPCPMPTPEAFWVEPVNSPTSALEQEIEVFIGNVDRLTVKTESGEFVQTFQEVRAARSVNIEINLLPDQAHHLEVSAHVPETQTGECVYQAYTLRTDRDKNGEPLVIEQVNSTQTPEGSGSNSATPENDNSGQTDLWNIYENEQYGFSFEYPAAYDAGPCGFSFTEDENGLGIHFGNSSSLTVTPEIQVSLEEYVDSVIREFSSDDTFQLERREAKDINGLPAETIDYRFGGPSRFGTAAFLIKDGHLFAFNLTAPASCEIPGVSVTEAAVYQHVIDTFKSIPYLKNFPPPFTN